MQETVTDEQRKKIRKFKESAWKCIYYLSAELFALAVTYNEPWFTKTRYFWVGPGDQAWPDQKYKYDFFVPYLSPFEFLVDNSFIEILGEENDDKNLRDKG